MDNAGWTKKVTPIASSTAADAAKYLYLYTCEQTKKADGTISCSPVLLDDSTTVIDGGKIITGSVAANQIAANAITAEKIKAGAIGTNQLAANAVTADKIQAGAIAIGDFNAETANLLNTAYNTANMATRSTQIGENSNILTNQ